MKAVRIRLTQTHANYRREETTINKMTYPLPPLSTVIGAIHSACNYTEYHKMKVSIQGKYESMSNKVYTDYAFLNSTMNDRGILVKLKNPQLLSTAYDVAAKACSQGADFDKEDKIDVVNRELLEEYQTLRKQLRLFDEKKKNEVSPVLTKLKKDNAGLKVELKASEKGTDQYNLIQMLIKENTLKMQEVLDEFDKDKAPIDTEYSKYASLTKSIKYYEILNGVELVIHIQSDEKTLDDIMEHVYDIRSIGRSEDFVHIIDSDIVELHDSVEKEIFSGYNYSAYIPFMAYSNRELNRKIGIYPVAMDGNAKVFGTKYLMNKNYEIVDKKRIFNKRQVLYISGYSINNQCDLGESTGIYYDGKYIVGLV